MNKSKDRCVQLLEAVKSSNLQDSQIQVEAVCVKENWSVTVISLVEKYTTTSLYTIVRVQENFCVSYPNRASCLLRVKISLK